MKNFTTLCYKKYSNKSKIYVFDLDDTLADINHRRHYLRQKERDWDAFNSECLLDKPIIKMVNLLKTLHNSGQIWILTCRTENCKEDTMDWLLFNNIPFERLYMREKTNFLDDNYVKENWLNNLYPFERNNIQCIFEDRQKVVDMWRKNNILCLQPCYGDF